MAGDKNETTGVIRINPKQSLIRIHGVVLMENLYNFLEDNQETYDSVINPI
jgi:hypothetical protein